MVYAGKDNMSETVVCTCMIMRGVCVQALQGFGYGQQGCKNPETFGGP